MVITQIEAGIVSTHQFDNNQIGRGIPPVVQEEQEEVSDLKWGGGGGCDFI